MFIVKTLITFVGELSIPGEHSENAIHKGENVSHKGGQMNFDSILPFKRWEASQEGRRGQILSKILKHSFFCHVEKDGIWLRKIATLV